MPLMTLQESQTVRQDDAGCKKKRCCCNRPWLQIKQESSGDEALIICLIEEHIFSVASLDNIAEA